MHLTPVRPRPARPRLLSQRRRQDLAEKRTAYQAYLAQLLTLAGESNAAERAAAVVQFERGIAKVQWTRVENRDDENGPTTNGRWPISRATRPASTGPPISARPASPASSNHPGRPAERLHRHRADLIARDAAGGAQGLSDAAHASTTPRPCSRRISSTPISPSTAPSSTARRRTSRAGSGRRPWSPARSPTMSARSTSSAISRPRRRRAADALVQQRHRRHGRRLQNLAWMAPETRAARARPSSPPSPPRSAIPTAGTIIRAVRDQPRPTSSATSCARPSSSIGTATSTSSAGPSTGANGA